MQGPRKSYCEHRAQGGRQTLPATFESWERDGDPNAAAQERDQKLMQRIHRNL